MQQPESRSAWPTPAWDLQTGSRPTPAWDVWGSRFGDQTSQGIRSAWDPPGHRHPASLPIADTARNPPRPEPDPPYSRTTAHQLEVAIPYIPWFSTVPVATPSLPVTAPFFNLHEGFRPKPNGASTSMHSRDAQRLPLYYQPSPHDNHYQPDGYGPPTTYVREPSHQPHSGAPQHPPYSGLESYVQRFRVQDTQVGEENMGENMDSNGQQDVQDIDDVQKLKIKQLREAAAKGELSACGTEKELLDVVRDNDIVKEEANGEKIVTTVKKDSVVMNYSESRSEPPAQTGSTPDESKEEPRIVNFISLICTVKQPLARVMSSCIKPKAKLDTAPLVLLHGFDSSCFEWRYGLPLLEDAGFETWAVDVLGWGFSDLEKLPSCSVASKRDHLYQVLVVHTVSSLGGLIDATVDFFTSGGYNVSAQIGEVKQQTLIIWGENDQIIDHKLAVRLHSEMPNAMIRQIPECGHIPHIEKPAAVSKLIAEFVQADSKVCMVA
ncbi:hypothetical protein SASPL_142743 [Salvia splendens]|uniref:AB hydrolase-1 domain-containing protein n=1 Tax=Salvia splendens TaxID=180675 RepID=A0A8X8WKV0_SALSN|nr:hypothetical protein SASPL_142743 [Salvia splendens]